MLRLLKMGMFGMVKSDPVMNIRGECFTGHLQDRRRLAPALVVSQSSDPSHLHTSAAVVPAEPHTSALLEVSPVLSPVGFTVWH